MNKISIEEFYKENNIHEDFDEVFYTKRYDGLTDFYQPHCRDNFISEKKRLYFHFIMYGKQMGWLAHDISPIKKYEQFDKDVLNEPISVVVSCQDRADMLNISVRSWLLQEQIKEIVITDWSSIKSIKYFENIDPRIKVIRVDGQLHYNASKPINLAIKEATYEKILKMDVDYILNPYLPLASLIDIKDNEFVAGDWRQKHLDNNLGFIENLNGILCCHKSLLLKAGLYNEDIDNYGREDCEMFERLEKTGGVRKHIEFVKNHVPVYHNPHNNQVRSINRKNPDTPSTLNYFSKKFGTKNFELVVNIHRDDYEPRRNEILECLKLNCDNKYIDHIHVFLEDYKDFPEFDEISKKYADKIISINADSRISFKEIFNYINNKVLNKQCIVANSDILFNEDLAKIRNLGPRDFFAITRHEGDKIAQNKNKEAICSHDAWIFCSPMISDFEKLEKDIIVGTYYSDTVLTYLLYKSKEYDCWNPCYSIKIQHMHNTTPHDSKTRTKDKTESDRLTYYYCNRFQDDEFIRLICPTDIEDYYLKKNCNRFISWHEFELNNYKY